MLKREYFWWITAWKNKIEKEKIDCFFVDIDPMETYNNISLNDEIDIDYMLESNVLLSACDDVTINLVPSTSQKYCLIKINISQNKYGFDEFKKTVKKDPRNKLYYEPPKKCETKFLKILYYTYIPLEDVEEEWIRLQDENEKIFLL